jgi:hypothetical protein
MVSEGSGAEDGFGILPSLAPAPYRVRQADAGLVEIGDTFSYRHELDRAYAALERSGHHLTVGRQAIGWGRGVMFSAVDIFAPFTPLESDREWRRGIDAARGSFRLTDVLSLELVAAFGESLDASSFVGRFQGYVGNVDGEIVIGWRSEDQMYAVTLSSVVGDAEVHGELALFGVPDPLSDGCVFGRDDLALKAVLGGSYSFDLIGGVWLVGEYHYSGFGIEDIADLGERGDEEGFIERYLRGDTQILGRHAGAVQAVFGLGSEHPVNLTWIFSPKDGSGVLVPSISWAFSDNVTIVASGYVPHGSKPEDGALQSEYGGTLVSGLLQMSFYY